MQKCNNNKNAIIGWTLLFFWVACMLLSLKYGWLNPFFWAAEHANVQGIDYFALPKSFLNLLEHRSMFDSWGGTPYGPHATWYLAHPAFSVFILSWFAFFTPWVSYSAFVIFSLLLLAYTGFLFAKHAEPAQKIRYYALLLCGFPVYWMVYVGNMHAPLVLATGLMLLALYEIIEQFSADNQSVAFAKTPIYGKLLAGLLLSLFSKPIAALLIPALCIVPETRKTTLLALTIYCVVSLMFIILPLFNPEGVGLQKLLTVVFDFNYIKETMNIYKNQFQLTPFMKDNSIHWLNLIAQSGYKLNHIENFSFPVFVENFLFKTIPDSIYRLPILVCLQGSLFLCFIRNKTARMQVLLLLTMMTTLSFFLSYNTVWEYQFTSVFPVIAMVYLLKKQQLFSTMQNGFIFCLAIPLYLPSAYILVDASHLSIVSIEYIRMSRIVPVLLLFMVITYKMIETILKALNMQQTNLHPTSAEII